MNPITFTIVYETAKSKRTYSKEITISTIKELVSCLQKQFYNKKKTVLQVKGNIEKLK